MAELAVIRKDAVPPGAHVVVQAGTREIGVFNVGGHFYAVRNRCPHQSGPVAEGGLFENVRADVAPDGRIREWIEDDGCILACPWHGWEFDVRTGACLWDPTYHLHMYKVREDDEGNLVIST